MKNFFASLFFISAICSFAFAQSPLRTLDKVKQLKFLESTREDAIKLLNNDDVGYYDFADLSVSYFFAEDANIKVFYSVGNCLDEYEDWDVSKGKVTRISISPKDYINIKDIGVDYSNFHKERPRKDYKKLYVYHDKKAGIAIWVSGGRIEHIILSPSEKEFPLLCIKPEVKKYYSSNQYVRDPKMKNASYHNFPSPDVNHLDLSRTEFFTACDSGNVTENKNRSEADATVNVSIVVSNPLNDILTYNYRISGGKIIGIGTKVVWDLSDVEAGTYKITGWADNGCGIWGRWITKTIVVKECSARLEK